MSKVVGDIAIKVGADTASLVTGMREGTASLERFAKVGAAAAGAVKVALVALTKSAMNNIDALSKQARAAGVSVSAFQAMSLVAEEAGVSSEQLSKTLVKMQDNITNLGKGGKEQADAFGALGLSFAKLKDAKADEQFALIAEAIDGITDPAAKTSAAIDVFGKSGADAINMLGGFRAAVANATEFQAKFGLAVSDVDAANIEAANDAMGRVTTSVQGLGTAFAVALAPAIETTANAMVGWISSLTGAQAELDKLLQNSDRAAAILGTDVVLAILKSGEVSDEAAVSIQKLGAAYDGLGRDVSVATNAMGDELSNLISAGFGDLALQISDVSGEMETLQGKFDAGAISAGDYETQMSAAITQANNLLIEASKIDGVNVSNAINQMSLLTRALSIARGVAISLRAALPGGQPANATSASGAGASASAAGTMSFGLKSSPRPERAPQNVDFGAVDVGDGGGGGGGGGGNSRIAALVDSLKTEQEITAEWYAASLDALNSASEAELAAIGGKHSAIERLEQEHQDRLKGIKDMGNQWGVEAALEGGAMILGAMASTNKRAAKLQGIFAAASALMSTYQGAAKELEKGTFGFASAAAVIAKGIGFVAAIKSASSSGGGGASSAGASAAQAPQQTNIANVTWIGQATVSGFQSLTEKLNAEFKQGYVLNIN